MTTPTAGRPEAILEKDKGRLIADYEKAKNLTELARKWRVSAQTVAKYLKRFGVELKPGRRKGNFNLGSYHPKLGIWRDSRVAKDLGVSGQAVGYARRARGIESPAARALRLAEGASGE